MEFEPCLVAVTLYYKEISFLGIAGLTPLRHRHVALIDWSSNGRQLQQFLVIDGIRRIYQESFMILTPGGRYTMGIAAY